MHKFFDWINPVNTTNKDKYRKLREEADKLIYRDRVEIIDGFYRGYCGLVIRVRHVYKDCILKPKILIKLDVDNIKVWVDFSRIKILDKDKKE